ncbi:hypothetical protein SAMN06296036_12725 [Pseudobacteriovorax antillogorgiicola]|uniref:Uncharacterized protein n=3 Tax=Pseudobacteriovorax antillogorgiicola TaxID=1513793 RepID=A0A1Y6CRR0_9BACT|nr:hypothetical protein EDD56_12726 [Pseudobacteriovorax antillogorgiicola]SMF72672.1 hypothetical protein SAMN06296036_12725 [Pseudobacteriovorax antillogorgiicola]
MSSGQMSDNNSKSMQLDNSNHSFSSGSGLSNAAQLATQRLHLPSSISQVNQALEGGLRWGELSEWGSPWGSGGRELIIRFLSPLHQASQEPYWCLWIQGQEGVNVYPPAWEAKGVNLKYIRFTKSLNPIKDLKPVFLNPFFKVIVLDCPQQLSAEDCQFLSRQARCHRQSIILIRNYFLSPKKGNVWAKLRLNCWHNHLHNQFYLKVVKGLSPRQAAFRLEH